MVLSESHSIPSDEKWCSSVDVSPTPAVAVVTL